jgi:hypothetical protein
MGKQGTAERYHRVQEFFQYYIETGNFNYDDLNRLVELYNSLTIGNAEISFQQLSLLIDKAEASAAKRRRFYDSLSKICTTACIIGMIVFGILLW